MDLEKVKQIISSHFIHSSCKTYSRLVDLKSFNVEELRETKVSFVNVSFDVENKCRTYVFEKI